MLINVLRDEEPTHVAVAFDVSRQTFRSEEYTEYKAGRSATPTEFSGQLPLLKEVLDALRVRHVEAPGYEADDILATLTTQAVAQGHEVVLCTGDRDAFQLVSDQVSMIYPVRGVSEVWRMNAAGGGGAVLRPAGALQRPRGARRRDERQPSRRARAWAQDRREVAPAVRRPRGDRRPRRRDQGQGGRVAARAPERRPAQPQAQPARPRRAPGGDDRRPRAPRVGPRGGAHGLRRPRVPGAARPALRVPRAGRGRGRGRLRGRRQRPAARGRGRLARAPRTGRA